VYDPSRSVANESLIVILRYRSYVPGGSITVHGNALSLQAPVCGVPEKAPGSVYAAVFKSCTQADGSVVCCIVQATSRFVVAV